MKNVENSSVLTVALITQSVPPGCDTLFNGSTQAFLKLGSTKYLCFAAFFKTSAEQWLRHTACSFHFFRHILCANRLHKNAPRAPHAWRHLLFRNAKNHREDLNHSSTFFKAWPLRHFERLQLFNLNAGMAIMQGFSVFCWWWLCSEILMFWGSVGKNWEAVSVSKMPVVSNTRPEVVGLRIWPFWRQTRFGDRSYMS